MTNRAERFWVVGHRGSPAAEVENTLPSFRRAVERDGANGLELDLCVTRDDEVVLWHDFELDEWRARFRRWGLEPVVRYRPVVSRTARRHRTTRDLTLRELRESYKYAEKRGSGGTVDVEVPTLETFMEWAARSAVGLVFLDVKLSTGAIDLLPILLRRVDACTERLRPSFRLVFESAHAAVIARLAELAPRHERTLDVEPPPGFVRDLDGSSAALAAIRHGCSCATPQKPRSVTLWPFDTHRKIVEADLARLREHNARGGTPVRDLCSFTINDEREMAELIRMGVHAIQSDRPDVLARVARAADSPARTEELESSVPRVSP